MGGGGGTWQDEGCWEREALKGFRLNREELKITFMLLKWYVVARHLFR